MDVDIRVGDSVEVLKTLEPESVDTCVTSPPYFGLRDYGVEGQIGQEDTVEAYVDKMVGVFREVRRVLKPSGTVWVNLGDSYSTRGGVQPPTNARNTNGHPSKRPVPSLPAKNLIGIPWRVAFALQADGWILRQDIIWSKPNGMPESVKDRCTRSHEYLFLLSKEKNYYFDAEAISEPIADSSVERYAQNLDGQKGSSRAVLKSKRMKAVLPRFGGDKYGKNDTYRTKSGNEYLPKPRRNKRDVWVVSTTPFKGAHFAVFPEKLVEPCILAGSPYGGTVLDPFVGSGTTGVVAVKNGRRIIGIDLNPQYAEMARDRIKEQCRQTLLEGF